MSFPPTPRRIGPNFLAKTDADGEEGSKDSVGLFYACFVALEVIQQDGAKVTISYFGRYF